MAKRARARARAQAQAQARARARAQARARAPALAVCSTGSMRGSQVYFVVLLITLTGALLSGFFLLRGMQEGHEK